MSQPDTFRVRQRIYRGFFFGAAAFGAWNTFTLLYNVGLIHFEFAYLSVGFSVVLQLIGLELVSRQNSDLDTRDFSVYRADSSAQVAR